VQQVGPGAVWQPGDASWQAMRQQCTNDSNYAGCLQSKLQAIAPPDAASFINWLNTQTNNLGWMTGFKKTGGTVGIGYVMYPLRANDNQEWLFVNGQPPAIDVDDLQNLPTADMQKDPAYLAMKKTAPDVALFPGDRSQSAGPAIKTLSGDQTRLVVAYSLLKGCHACAVLGSARFGFDFSSTGKLLDIKFLDIRQTTTGEDR
jgi:hypothetical protein